MASGHSETAADFRILGSLEVACDGQLVTVKPAQARALLALLLLEPGRVVSADRLVDELWGDRPPASAAASLRVLVSRLRETLAAAGLPKAIATRSPGYALEIDPGQVDVRRFETLLARGHEALTAGEAQLAAATLRDALALWRGSALADVADSPAAAAEAARLNEARLLALEARIDADLACARHTTVIAELESLVRAHPLRERLWAARILALYRCGRQADALAAFIELRERLVQELGIEPSPDLRALQQRVLDHDPALSPTTPAAPQPTGSPSGVVTFLLTDIEGSSRLWERDPEQMRRALARHDEIIAQAVPDAKGVLVKSKGEGDSTFSVFARASDAIRAAQAVQAAHRSEPWPEGTELNLRAALHTGEAQESATATTSGRRSTARRACAHSPSPGRSCSRRRPPRSSAISSLTKRC